MEKTNMYPEMPPLPGGMPDLPPTYDQSNPTAPLPDMTPMMPSSVAGPSMQPQPMQQQQFNWQPQPTVLVQSLPPNPPLGPHSCRIICPCCHQQQTSNIRLESSTKTHLFALALCVLGLFCCACIPYCVDSCKNANHYCSNCKAYLGTYKN